MSFTRPILRSIIPFPSTSQQIFDFYYEGGNQAIRNQLTIERTSDNVVVYNSTQETFSLRHTLSPSTLTNGIEYKARIRVGDINNNWSDYSDYIIFWVLSIPNFEITNIDYANQNRVYNQTVLFQATYSHTNNEQLQSYRFLLYDSNQNLLQSFPEQFANGSTPLTQEITGLENGTLYYIEVKTLSVHGQQGSSSLINFRPFYIAPRLSAVITPENLTEQGAIKISANIIQIIGKLYDQNGNEINPVNIQYIDGEWLDLTRPDYKVLIFENGFNIMQADFMMKIWRKNIPENIPFIVFPSPFGRIELIRISNKIHAFKYINGINLKPHFASNEYNFVDGQEFTIYFKQQNHLIELIVESV